MSTLPWAITQQYIIFTLQIYCYLIHSWINHLFLINICHLLNEVRLVSIWLLESAHFQTASALFSDSPLLTCVINGQCQQVGNAELGALSNLSSLWPRSLFYAEFFPPRFIPELNTSSLWTRFCLSSPMLWSRLIYVVKTYIHKELFIHRWSVPQAGEEGAFLRAKV